MSARAQQKFGVKKYIYAQQRFGVKKYYGYEVLISAATHARTHACARATSWVILMLTVL